MRIITTLIFAVTTLTSTTVFAGDVARELRELRYQMEMDRIDRESDRILNEPSITDRYRAERLAREASQERLITIIDPRSGEASYGLVQPY